MTLDTFVHIRIKIAIIADSENYLEIQAFKYRAILSDKLKKYVPLSKGAKNLIECDLGHK